MITAKSSKLLKYKVNWQKQQGRGNTLQSSVESFWDRSNKAN